ncbi:hypothetical protein GCM10027062_24830 [Nocardioides hungaricus]
MAYRETYSYVVLCDRCGVTAPEGTGWWTPAIADRAAIEAGWVMTRTEHLCPSCSAVEAGDEGEGAAERCPSRAALRPSPEPARRTDVCWPPSSPAADQAWEGTR